MKQENNYNIKFIKISGILYALGHISALIYFMMEGSNTSSGGGNNGGGGGVGIVIGSYVIGTAVILVLLNFVFAKPKPEDKYLRFLPLLILLNAYALFISLTRLRILGILILIAGFFLMKYVLPNSKWSLNKKRIILLPIILIIINHLYITILYSIF